jgi:hypothetical protein
VHFPIHLGVWWPHEVQAKRVAVREDIGNGILAAWAVSERPRPGSRAAA